MISSHILFTHKKKSSSVLENCIRSTPVVLSTTVFLQRWLEWLVIIRWVFLREFLPKKEKILEIFLLHLELLRPFRNFVSKEKKILIECWPGGFVFIWGGGGWWIIEKAREFQKKHLLLLYWLCPSLWLYGSQQTVENFSRDRNSRPNDLPPEKSICRSGSKS